MPIIRFGDFELDDETFELRQSGARVRLQQQPARVLAFLLSRRGSLVTRDQLREAIWGGDTFVDFEQGLNFCIRQIRITLKDQHEKPLYIETLPRLGYRFLPDASQNRQPEASEKRNRKRIAVLPVEDLAGADNDYFAAGLTEDMLSALSRIDPDHLRVTAGPRLTGAEVSGDRLDRVQRELNLDFLLRASVRRSQDRIRIIAQLHDLRDRSVLWSETYNRESTDLLAVQEDVTRRVSQSLALELLPGAMVGSRKYSQSSAAYDSYLKGRFFWHKMTPEGIRSSIAHFNEALAIDPAFAPASAGLADCYAQMGSIRVSMMKPFDALAKARLHLQRALEVDDTLAEAHCTHGLIKCWYDLDWTGAEREFQTALALDPSQVTALLWQSLYFSAVGRHEEAIASVQRARESEPLSVASNLYLAVAQTHAGQYDLALRQYRSTLELDPNYYRTYLFLGRALNFTGRQEEAHEAFQRALALNPDNLEALAMMGSVLAEKGDKKGALEVIERLRAAAERTEPALMEAIVYASLGDATAMFDSLNIAVERKSVPIYIVQLQEQFRRYRTDPRFASLLTSIGLDSLIHN
jgi:TolB-like protein/Tfp pilus assembly protein PilF